MGKPMIADVVQEMIWKIVKETGLTQEELGRFMEAWAAVRGLEAAEADREFWRAFIALTTSSAGRRPSPSPQGEGMSGESTPESAQKVHPDGVEKVHEDTEEIATSSAEQSPAPSPPGEGEKVVQNGPDPAKSAAAAAGMANRKRNDMARLEALRARGVSMQTVAESAAGLTLNDVLDFIDRKPIQLPKLVALEKAMKKLEAEA